MNGNYFEITGRVNYIEIQYANNGNAYTRVIIGKKKKSSEKEFESYVITFFGENAEEVVNEIEKGDMANITGRMQITKYKDKNGNDIEKIALIGDTYKLAAYDTENKCYVPTNRKAKKTAVKKVQKEEQGALNF